MKLRLKSCPRCYAGDLALAKDFYGSFWECIQCGYLEENKVEVRQAPSIIIK